MRSMSGKTNNKNNKLSIMVVTRNNSFTTQNKLRRTGVIISSAVAGSIVHRETAAIACNNDESAVDNLVISSGLASSVSKKAFAISVQVANKKRSPGDRLGQGGFIRCLVPTLSDSPPLRKKQELLKPLDTTRGPALLAPAIKQSSSAARISVVPVTVLHNVVKDVVRGEHYNVTSVPIMTNNDGVTRVHEFKRCNEAYVPAAAKPISFPGANSFLWKYGFDMTTGAELIRKVTMVETDPNLSFEAVDSKFEYKVGQKIGIAVYRNYKFDFTNDDIYVRNGWKKEDFSQDDIMRIFGDDNAVSIYTGEVTAVSLDRQVFRHSINSFGGCSGAIVFLLDKNQNFEGDRDDYRGKAIGVHVGTCEETATTTTADGTESQSSHEQFNFAFALAGFAEQYVDPEEE